MYKSGVQSVRAAGAQPMRSSNAQVSSNPSLHRQSPSETFHQASSCLACLPSLEQVLPSTHLPCHCLFTTVLSSEKICSVSGTGIAPAAMRKMGGPYTGTGHATLLAAMCGVLTSHGTTLPALGLTPGHKELPGEQVGLG